MPGDVDWLEQEEEEEYYEDCRENEAVMCTELLEIFAIMPGLRKKPLISQFSASWHKLFVFIALSYGT